MARPHAPRGQGRARVIAAALELFADHGVSGTSLQMIAERLGVTKAAVYYQFHAKEDIVVAVLEEALGELRRGPRRRGGRADAGRRERPRARRAGRPDHPPPAGHGHAAPRPRGGRIVESHPEFQRLAERLTTLLQGPDPDLRRRVAVAVVGGGLAQAGMDPRLGDLDDDELRAALLAVARDVLSTPA